MAQESYADFSIIKKYMDLKTRYDVDIQSYKERLATLEEQCRQQQQSSQQELTARNEQLQAMQQKIQELGDKLKEKDEQLKNLGLQAHKMKTELEEARNRIMPEEEKKGKFSIFK
jgi:archaellum component FlaC